MADAITRDSQGRGDQQWNGLFKEMWTVKGTISDQDAVTANDTTTFSLTVTGVALGDMVIAVAVDEDLSDGTDQAIMTGVVTAADTLGIRVHADVGEFAADNLNNKVVKALIARPNW